MLKILVVDDRRENLLALVRLLERPDLDILTATSGDEALGLMLDHDLALVLLDVQMPEMNGFEVAELMRRNPRTSRIPIIFVTAINKERRQIFTGYEAGAVDYLFKPVDPFIIRAKVAVFLEMKRTQLARERLVRQLNRTNNRLQELNDRKSDFLAAASHELRTPLTVIKEHCSLVREGIVGEVGPDQAHCLDIALRNCNRLAGLVDDLLDLNGIESGATACRRQRIDGGALLATCVEDFRGSCAQQDQELVLDAASDVPPLLADPALITQVIVNLVGNAHKFTPAGGRITVTARRDGDEVAIDVADTGPGIPPGDRDRVFEKFTRLAKPGSAQRGTGLGLAIARRIVELHDGAIVAGGEFGRGAVFNLRLPAATDANHLRAFVTDGTQVPGAATADWTLLLLRPDDGPGGAADLVATLDGILRRGRDRADLVRHRGEEYAAALLAVRRDGMAPVLARLEAELTVGDGNPDYALVAVTPDRRAEFALVAADLAFAPLRLPLPTLDRDRNAAPVASG